MFAWRPMSCGLSKDWNTRTAMRIAAPVIAGPTEGIVIVKKVRTAPAPLIAAASSSDWSRFLNAPSMSR